MCPLGKSDHNILEWELNREEEREKDEIRKMKRKNNTKAD